MVIEEKVPCLDNDVEIYPFNKSEYLVQQTRYKHQINVNAQTYHLLSLVDGKRSISEIASLFENRHESVITPQMIYAIFYERLAKYGIVQNDELKVERRRRSPYLKLSFVFLKARYVAFLTKWLVSLFERSFFYVSLLLFFCFISFTVVVNFSVIIGNIASLVSYKVIWYIMAFQLGTLLHELGHAAACRRYGAAHGDIGFGFYLFTPVFFADVSDAWKLRPYQRVIVNLGGIYMEMFLASILLFVFWLTGDVSFLVIPCLLILSTLYNLNPLLKFDGYWVLSDLTNTPNLHKKSAMVFREKASMIGRKRLSFQGHKEVFLFIYAIVSTIFIFGVLSYIILNDPYTVLGLPMQLYRLFSNWSTFEVAELKNLIFPIIFWLLVIKLLIGQVKKYRRARLVS